MYSNNKWIAKLCQGRLTKVEKAKMNLDVKTTKRIANGGYQGSSQLKGTQTPVCNKFAAAYFFVYCCIYSSLMKVTGIGLLGLMSNHMVVEI